MKFDVVIMNPPYQAAKERTTEAVTGACGSELWKSFVEKSLKLVNENGFVCSVHPSKWRKPEHELFPILKSKDLKYVEIHSIDDGIKTFSASTGYDWYVLKNALYNGETLIKDMNGQLELVDLTDFSCVPSSHFDLFKRLLAKNDEKKCEILFSYSGYETRKPWMSCQETSEFKHPCVYGLTKGSGLKVWYSNTTANGHFGAKKVIIPVSKYTDAFIDKNGDYGICQFAFGIKFNTLKEAEGIKKAIMSEEFKKIWQATEWISNSKEWRVFKSFRADFWKEFI